MNLSYQKINVDLSDLDCSKVISTDLEFVILKKTFFQYRILDNNYLQSYIETKLNFGILPDVSHVTEIIHPGITIHKDRWKTALNFYISTDPEDTTTFYTNPVQTTSFNNNDCILMNTHVPHAVNVKNKNAKRLILRFAWMDREFDEILNSISVL